LFLIFENEFGKKLTPIEAKQILNWQEKFGTDLIEEALRRSVLQGKLSLNYIGKILSSWESAGLRSIQDVLKNDPLRQAESATEATKVVQLQSRRREEKIKAACDYIALQLGPNPPREQAEEIARGYGEDTVAEILDKLYENGGRSP
jgi:DnaD/phage-associated family protein